MENKCILCGKKKENHIKCTTNEKVLWCYNNKEYPKKWAYQYTTKKTDDAKHENDGEKKQEETLSSKKQAGYKGGVYAIPVSDVKEFIKKLKEDLPELVIEAIKKLSKKRDGKQHSSAYYIKHNTIGLIRTPIMENIDKLAGEDLI